MLEMLCSQFAMNTLFTGSTGTASIKKIVVFHKIFVDRTGKDTDLVLAVESRTICVARQLPMMLF